MRLGSARTCRSNTVPGLDRIRSSQTFEFAGMREDKSARAVTKEQPDKR